MMLDLTEIITKRTFRWRGFVVVPPQAEARGCLISNLFPRLIIRNAAKNQAWQGGETPANFATKPKTTTEINTTK